MASLSSARQTSIEEQLKEKGEGDEGVAIAGSSKRPREEEGACVRTQRGSINALILLTVESDSDVEIIEDPAEMQRKALQV